MPLLELDHTGLLRYPEWKGLHGLQGRLRLSRPSRSVFGLEIQRIHEGDNGTYQCRVEQYQVAHEGQLEQKASADGGPIMLSVKFTGRTIFGIFSYFSYSWPQARPGVPNRRSGPQGIWYQVAQKDIALIPF